MASLFCCRAVSQGPDLKRRSFSWRKLISWSMIDFSNSLVLMIVVMLYPGYFTAYYMAGNPSGKERVQSSLTISNIVVSVIMIVLSPPLGALSDVFYIRVPTLVISTALFGAFTICLYTIPAKRPILYYVAMHTLINIFFRINETVNGSFLPSLCNDRDLGFASGMGFCIGFLSGVIVIWIFRSLNATHCYINPRTGTCHKIPDPATGLDTITDWTNLPLMKDNLGFTMMLTGIIMLISSLPPILMMSNGVPEGEKRPRLNLAAFVEAFKELGRSFKGAFSVTPVVTVLLIAYGIFWWASNHGASSMAINTQRLTGYQSAAEPGDYGYSTTLMADVVLVYNLCVAFPSILFGLFARKTGSKPWIIVAASAMVLSDIPVFCWKELAGALGIRKERWAYFLVYLNAAFMAFGQGPIQSLIRGAVLVLSPTSKKGEIMGIFEMFQLLSCLLGNLTANLSYGRQDVYNDYIPFAVIPLVLATITLFIVIFTPLGKAEKAKREEMAKYGSMTLDEVEVQRRRERKQAGEEGDGDAGFGSPTVGDREISGDDDGVDAEQQRGLAADSSETTSTSSSHSGSTGVSAPALVMDATV